MPEKAVDAQKGETDERSYVDVIRESNEVARLERRYAVGNFKDPMERLACIVSIVTREIGEALEIPDPDPQDRGITGKPSHVQWERDRQAMFDLVKALGGPRYRPAARPVHYHPDVGDGSFPMYRVWVEGDDGYPDVVYANHLIPAIEEKREAERRRASEEACGPWETAWLGVRVVLRRYGVVTWESSYSLRQGTYTLKEKQADLEAGRASMPAPMAALAGPAEGPEDADADPGERDEDEATDDDESERGGVFAWEAPAP